MTIEEIKKYRELTAERAPALGPEEVPIEGIHQHRELRSWRTCRHYDPLIYGGRWSEYMRQCQPFNWGCEMNRATVKEIRDTNPFVPEEVPIEVLIEGELRSWNPCLRYDPLVYGGRLADKIRDDMGYIAWKTMRKIKGIPEALVIALAYALPKRVVYWCVIRAGAVASTGEYGHNEVGSLTVFDILDRWRKSYDRQEEK